MPDFDELAAGILHEKLTDLKPSFIRRLGAFFSKSGIASFGSAIFVICIFGTVIAYPKAK